MKDTKTFQTIFIALFGLIGLMGIACFAGYFPGCDSAGKKSDAKVQSLGVVSVWGTVPRVRIGPTLSAVSSEAGNVRFSYEEKSMETIEEDLLRALITDSGPEMLLTSQADLYKYKDLIQVIAFSPSLDERAYKDTFLEQGELFLSSEGMDAIPLVSDPLVMYWNRDIFSNAGLTRPPELWDELMEMAPKLTKRDAQNRIVQSAVALGEYDNVENAKDILVMMSLQIGNEIIVRKGVQDYKVVFTQMSEEAIQEDLRPGVNSALTYFLQFSNPSKPAYSWNRSMPNSREAFIAGDLAIYFGFASELPDIQLRNPHINFDLALVPQIRETDRLTTYGNMYGLSLVKNARNKKGALGASALLTSEKYNGTVAEKMKVAPVRRSLLSAGNIDAVSSVVNRSALIARGWYDPDPVQTEIIFGELITTVLSGERGVAGALSVVTGQLKKLIKTEE